MLDVNDLNDQVFEAIFNNMALDEDEAIEKMALLSVEEAFDKWLNWHGIIGYTSQIIQALDNLRWAERTQAELERESRFSVGDDKQKHRKAFSYIEDSGPTDEQMEYFKRGGR